MSINLYIDDQISNEDLIQYLVQKQYYLNFLTASIFDYINIDKNNKLENLYNSYKNNFSEYKKKYLIDTLLYESNKSPICFLDHGKKFFLTKGNNKVIACLANQINFIPMFFISKEKFGYTVKDSNELYEILKCIDNLSDKFTIELDSKMKVPSIHLIENQKTVYNWFPENNNFDSLIEKSKLQSNLILFGNLINSSNEQIVFKNINEFIEYCDTFDEQHRYFAYSFKPYNLEKNYIEFCLSNFYLKTLNKIGRTKKNDIWIYDRFCKENNLSFIPYPHYL